MGITGALRNVFSIKAVPQFPRQTARRSSGRAVNTDPRSGLVIDKTLINLVVDGEFSPKLRNPIRPRCGVLRDTVERNKSAGSHKRRVHLEVLPYSFAGMIAINKKKIDHTTLEQSGNALSCGFAMRVTVH